MVVLVTGAAGFPGRAICAAFRARGDAVVALVGAKDGATARAQLEGEGVRLCEGDIEDEDSVERAARGADVLVHAAERSRFGGTFAEHERVNLIGTENVLAAAKRAGVRRLVYLSSEQVTAGDYARDYVTELFPHADTFVSAYAETKALAEALVLAASGIETVALRPGWVWGPGDTVLLPEWIRRMRAHTLRLVDGGRALVPTSYVDNLAAGVVLAATVPAAASNVYYLTDDERISCKSFLVKVLGAAGMGAPRANAPYRAAYVSAWIAEKLAKDGVPANPARTRAAVVAFGRTAFFNVSKAREELGYDPAVRIDEGARRLAAWVSEVGGADAVVRGATE